MRKRFTTELTLGQTLIKDIKIDPKSKNALDHLVVALKELYCNPEYNEKIFSIIEKYLSKADRNNGRPGMNLWTIFVLAQVRLCLNYSYCMLHNSANNHLLLRQLLGIDFVFNEEPYVFEYQNIYDNVSKLSDEMLKEINDVIVEFGHKEVFKKKESTALHLKTDSFVLESNVHFPTDYNLLWDCMRKSIDTVEKFIIKYPYLRFGWRKIKSWRFDIKNSMREVGKISKSSGKNKEKRLHDATKLYLKKIKLLLEKINKEKENFPLSDTVDVAIIIELERYISLAIKHIDLVERRILKGETIPQAEKMMSIFETYTEWVAKGKSRPPVELGKMVSITSDQYDLILYHIIMDKEQDRDIVIKIADKMLSKYKKIDSHSFDKGHWSAENRDLLALEIPRVILPKLGKLNAKEKELESSKIFKRLKNKHSAVESNINELEHRGLDRCPDRGYHHFKAYVALGVCAYNLKKIGKKILENQLKELLSVKAA